MTIPERASTLRLSAPFLPVGLALLCIQLDFFSLNLALPTIAADLDRSTTDLQWLVSGYMIALGSLLIPAGRCADIAGRRTVLLWGIAIFGSTSLVCGVTSSVTVLIVARALQGLGAAMIFPAAFAVVTNATAEDVRPRVTGALLGVAGVGTALGPVVGGVLASTVGWRWVFLINVPVVLLAIVLGLRLPNSRDDTHSASVSSIDWGGAITVVGGLALLSIAIDDVSSRGALAAGTLLPLVAGLILLVAFVLNESRVAHPLVQPSLVRNRTFVVLALTGTIANIGNCVTVYVASLDLQNIRGLAAAAAGGAFFASSIGLAVTGPLAGRLSTAFPPSIVMGWATLLAAPPALMLAFVRPLPAYVVALALCGLTCGMGYALGQLAVQTVLPAKRAAEGSSVMLTLMISFSGVGVVAAAAVIEAGGGTTRGGLALVLTGMAALLLIAGLVTLLAEYPRLRRGSNGRPAPAD